MSELGPKDRRIYPAEAKRQLENMGYEEKLITIARGTKPFLLGPLQMKMRKADGEAAKH